MRLFARQFLALPPLIFSLAVLSDAIAASPVAFEFRKSGDRVPMRNKYVIHEVDHLVSGPWIFKESSLTIACSSPAIEVFQIANRYGALNGTTATLSEKIDVIDDDGIKRAIEPGRDNRDYVTAGLIKAEATNPEIGSWLSALTRKLSADCDNH